VPGPADNPPDRELVAAALAGAPGAFERLVRVHQALVWHVIGRAVHDREETRDLAQEAFLRVHRLLHQFRHESSLRTWIGRIAWSVALRHLERKRLPLAEPAAADDDAIAPLDMQADALDVEGACADAELAGLLHAAVAALPPLPRTVLTLYHLEELSLAEIAGITGLATGTIKSYLFRARLRLRAVLARRLGETA
jgi:RNA polymerase sigma-70 factor (ECF subfamily)